MVAFNIPGHTLALKRIYVDNFIPVIVTGYDIKYSYFLCVFTLTCAIFCTCVQIH